MLAMISNMLMAQVDMYDITTHENVNIHKNVNQNIHVGGAIYENKTITTIDYGALASANAEMQRLQFERQQYSDEKQRRIALEMAANPIKAYDYGYEKKGTTKFNKKEAEKSGIKCYSMSYIVPHADFFYMSGNGLMENINSDGTIRSEIAINIPIAVTNKDFDLESASMYSYNRIQIGINDSATMHPYFVYRKNITRTNCFGNAGYKLSFIFEDEYQYGITDIYQSYNEKEKVITAVIYRTYCSKDDSTFEKLEGRRYYLKPLAEKVISTGIVSDVKLVKTK